ncbi:hypothetical protein HRG_010550 [Hirsutella rhossiliensis]|uniref:DUF7728 domain-containing protein n=1 Tax=Hirsutella rhossiliensis TaxID=111463 RepID=A0A9P8SDR9_9HYPO|nr:uncharacterized protein HRG_10550 [Hirsutella rhossiliensis]KAH0958249.1 hypothetical protein HRG_10550 [Hirsutella rhossiliensis]
MARDANALVKTPASEADSLDLPADQGQCLSIRCEQCQGRDSHIRLEFTIADKTKLLANGLELFPNPGTEHGLEMTASVNDDDAKKEDPHDQLISYGLSVALEDKDATENVSLINVDYKIREVDGAVVQGVPVVHLKLIELGSDELLLGSITTMENDDINCGAVQCWAYKLTGATFGGPGEEALLRCCNLRKPQSEPSRNTTAHDAHDWYETVKLKTPQSFQPMLLGFVAFAMLAV